MVEVEIYIYIYTESSQPSSSNLKICGKIGKNIESYCIFISFALKVCDDPCMTALNFAKMSGDIVIYIVKPLI